MSKNYSSSYIHQYLKGELDKEKTYQLEKEALSDPFLADTIYGYELILKKYGHTKAQDYLKDISEVSIEKTVHKSINKKKLIIILGGIIILSILGVMGWNKIKDIPIEATSLNKIEEKNNSLLTVSEELLESYFIDIYLEDGNGNALEGKTIQIYNKEFKTDESGRFRLQPLKTGTNFNIEIEGFKSQEIYIPKKYQDKVTIQLTREKSRDKNSVIQKDKLFAPEGGWYKFQSYVENNKKLPENNLFLKGSVIVKASLSKNNALNEIQVIQSINEAYDQEAIRLIKNYNAWKNKMGAPIVIFIEVIF